MIRLECDFLQHLFVWVDILLNPVNIYKSYIESNLLVLLSTIKKNNNSIKCHDIEFYEQYKTN